MKEKDIIKIYGVMGWAVLKNHYTLEQLNNLTPMEIVMLTNDFDKFIAGEVGKMNAEE